MKLEPRKARRAAVTRLPFVADRKVGRRIHRCWWEVPPTTDYVSACRIGAVYAKAYVDYLLSENESNVGSGFTHLLVADMANVAQRNDESRGYGIGFFSAIEQYIAAGAYVIRDGSTPSVQNMHKWAKKRTA